MGKNSLATYEGSISSSLRDSFTSERAMQPYLPNPSKLPCIVMHRWEGEERSERSCSASSEQSNNQFNPAFALLLAARCQRLNQKVTFMGSKGLFFELDFEA
uniref:Uncharacterized protein n=1 Tax=Cannabis sativa TaxID=3483 RepID=A0A803Q745_CANSA